MKLLVIGSGGREHALVWKLAQSRRVSGIWCAPGNAGIARERLASDESPAQCVPMGAEDLPALLDFAKENHPDLTVVGPDNPLALGIADLFQENGFRIWGPNQNAARFESSKVFSQEFMQRHGIPTARARAFGDPAEAKRFARTMDGKCAVKADGLALGKGVLICRDPAGAEQAIDRIMVERDFGEAGAKVVIQELLEGVEASLHALCDGGSYKLFPSSQDHKPVFDGNQGPNTGGMGTYSPAPFLNDEQIAEAGRKILDPWLAGCREEGIDYRGLIYPGLMLTSKGPKVIEFNSRFGDPETQVYLPRLENDLVDLLEACIDGRLDEMELKWRPESAVCVVLASGGYPGKYEKGKPISGLDEANGLPNTQVFHAGTRVVDGQIVTNGGRVLGVTAWAADLTSAREAAYRAVEKIKFENVHFRRDIGARSG